MALRKQSDIAMMIVIINYFISIPLVVIIPLPFKLIVYPFLLNDKLNICDNEYNDKQYKRDDDA